MEGNLCQNEDRFIIKCFGVQNFNLAQKSGKKFRCIEDVLPDTHQSMKHHKTATQTQKQIVTDNDSRKQLVRAMNAVYFVECRAGRSSVRQEDAFAFLHYIEVYKFGV